MKNLKRFLKIVQYIIYSLCVINVPLSIVSWIGLYKNNHILILMILVSVFSVIQYFISKYSLLNFNDRKYNASSGALTAVTGCINNIYILMHTWKDIMDKEIFFTGMICFIINAVIAIKIIQSYYKIYED